jgi:hypothetical protein
MPFADEHTRSFQKYHVRDMELVYQAPESRPVRNRFAGKPGKPVRALIEMGTAGINSIFTRNQHQERACRAGPLASDDPAADDLTRNVM